MTVREMKKRLIGRKIVGFEANAFRDGRSPKTTHSVMGAGEDNIVGGDWTYDPVLILDDGSRVRFITHETETGDYGIDPVIHGGPP